MRRPNYDDVLAGFIFIAFGAFFIWGARDLEIGPALQMGPGNFPVALTSILCLIGLAVTLRAFFTEPEAAPPVRWRGVILTLLAPLIFGLTIRGGGFVPAVALSTFTSACASTRFRIGEALSTTAAITIGCLVIFVYALKVSIPVFGPWIID